MIMSHFSGKLFQYCIIFLIVVVWYCPGGTDGVKRLLKNRLSPEDIRKPFVLLYEHESFRGKEVMQFISKACINLPEQYANWASSVDTHRACAQVCITENCAGPCHNVYSNQGVSKLRRIGFNDQIKSVRTCF